MGAVVSQRPNTHPPFTPLRGGWGFFVRVQLSPHVHGYSDSDERRYPPVLSELEEGEHNQDGQSRSERFDGSHVG